MKIHSSPRNWRWLPMYNVYTHPTTQNLLKNNPDVQFDINLQGYWIRPDSKTYVVMILNGTYEDTTETTWHTNIDGPNWRDHD